jgi:hypothetical protein
MKQGVASLVLVFICGALSFVSFSNEGEPRAACVLYSHGAAVHAGVSKADQDIAGWFASILTGDPESGMAVEAGVHTFFGIATGSIEKGDVLRAQALCAARLPDDGALVSVGYSAGGGALWDLTAGRNVESEVAALHRQYRELAEEKGLLIRLVLIDSFTRIGGWGWIPGVAQAQPMSKANIDAIGAFLLQGHAILAVHFGGHGPWHGVSVVQNTTDGTYREMRKTRDSLIGVSEDVGTDLRFDVFGPESDVLAFWNGPNPLGDLDHKSFSQSDHTCLAFIELVVEWFDSFCEIK